MDTLRADTILPVGTERAEPVIEAVNHTPVADGLIEQLAALTTGYTPDPESEQKEPTYYDYPVLKAPIWRWEIVWYFFFGGLAAGCYVIASIAALFSSKEDRAITRAGYYLSLLALLPCPPLLIKDLGRPERFLHMLRIFKVKSPMSMGVWALVGFSFFSGLGATIQAARDGLLGKWWGAKFLAALPQRLLAIPGIFSGFFLGSYTGVLLAATSIPLWSRSKLLGAIFISSAVSTSSALISLVLRIFRVPAKALHKLEKLEWTAMLLEIVGLLFFLRGSGRAARPLVGAGPDEHGRTFWRFMFGGGLVLPWLLQTRVLFGNRARKRGGLGLLISLLVLIGGYFLRRTLIDAGHSSSRDARTTLWNARR
ncbi:MAG: polysulfide reductase NrfD [Ktedonobacteraceae bacterium]|nr:polysulfide reductase NrfD [Ktedonobacteraceae bacterium]